jgi:hypothetical protein
MRRNYPAMQRRDVVRLLDLGNAECVLRAALGLPSPPPAEAQEAASDVTE